MANIKEVFGSLKGLNIRGDGLYDDYGTRVYSVRGDELYDVYGTKLYSVRGEYIINPYGTSLFEIRGDELYTRTGSRVTSFDDLDESRGNTDNSNVGSDVNVSNDDDYDNANLEEEDKKSDDYNGNIDETSHVPDKLFFQFSSSYKNRNYVKARDCLVEAAKMGCKYAQFSLAKLRNGKDGYYIFYFDPRINFYMWSLALKSSMGMKIDEEEAKYWLRKAAQRGHPIAQFELGDEFYLKGDIENAKHWLTLAANNLTAHYASHNGDPFSEESKKAVQKKLKNINEGKKYGDCYIATCVYGSYDCQEVWTLRRYRDSELSTSIFGRYFIQIYYAVSPKIVKLFGNNKWFHKLWKPVIDCIVHKLQKRGIVSGQYTNLE